MTSPIPLVALNALRALLPQRCSDNASVCLQHGRDESWHPAVAPALVCWPHSTEEVAAVVNICRQYQLPMVPFGAGTSLEGHVIPTQVATVCIDLSQMNQILAIHSDDLDCRVQAGVTRKSLNHELRHQGLFFPVDPGADASLGGMASTRASGTNAVRYGTMATNVLGLTAVMADGQIIQTGSRARKSSAGYDLTRLLVGAEGTLGIITEVALRLYGIPEQVSAARVYFHDLAAAVDTVIAAVQMGIPLARLELVDEVGLQAIHAHSGLSVPDSGHALFIEFHGGPAAVAEQVQQFHELALQFGGSDFVWADDSEQQRQMWQARHQAYYAAVALQPGGQGWCTDVCVPVSQLARCIIETQQDLRDSQLQAPIIGHVGDGNFHLVFSLDPSDAEQKLRVESFNERLVQRALSMSGTCTGEHGIGVGKLAFMAAEHGAALAVMGLVKQALDPLNLMNPGKILPSS